MPEFPPTLTPEALAALLERVDEVCAQAKELRVEIAKAMRRRSTADARANKTRTSAVRRRGAGATRR